MPKWINTFGKENIFIIKAEDLNEEMKAKAIMQSLFSFLDLPVFDMGNSLQEKYNAAPTKKMPEAIEKELKTFFESYNSELKEMIKEKGFSIC